MPFDALDHKCANTIRGLAIDAIQAANSGHPGLPLGTADMAYVLFSRFVHTDPKDTKWVNRDRFVLSGGIYSIFLSFPPLFTFLTFPPSFPLSRVVVVGISVVCLFDFTRWIIEICWCYWG